VLDDKLAAFVAEAVGAWPRFRVSTNDFMTHVRARLPEEGGTAAEAALAELRPAELYLAFACLRRDEDAWRELDRAYLAKVPEFVARVERSPAFADEVRQRLSEKLAGDDGEANEAKLAQYSGRGSLKAWLRIAAIREAHTIVRAGKRAVDADAVPLRAGGPDPEIALLKQRSAAAFRRAFEEVLSGLSDDDRTLLRLHYIDGLTIDEVGKAFRVSRASAARLLAAARERIVKRVERALRDQLGANAPGAHSLLELVESQLDLSILRHFRSMRG
jgi:RNA polymerase sigma-70 factor (ECF subfamily)